MNKLNDASLKFEKNFKKNKQKWYYKSIYYYYYYYLSIILSYKIQLENYFLENKK